MKDLSDHMQVDPLARQGSSAIKEIAVSMKDFPSPLDPTLNCRGLTYVHWEEGYPSHLPSLATPLPSLFPFCSVDKCKVMDSKMKPLWLVFDNQDVLGEGIYQIFKNGDGKCGEEGLMVR